MTRVHMGCMGSRGAPSELATPAARAESGEAAPARRRALEVEREAGRQLREALVEFSQGRGGGYEGGGGGGGAADVSAAPGER